jgi:hypothetical protein
LRGKAGVLKWVLSLRILDSSFYGQILMEGKKIIPELKKEKIGNFKNESGFRSRSSGNLRPLI